MCTKMKRIHHRKLAILLLTLGAPLDCYSTPAPWYRWQSLTTGKQICRQNSPGEGWRQLPKAYQDAGCKIPIKEPSARENIPKSKRQSLLLTHKTMLRLDRRQVTVTRMDPVFLHHSETVTEKF